MLVAIAMSITATNTGAQTTVAGIDHYLADLYLPADAKPSAAMTDPDQPLLILLHVLSTSLMPDRIPDLVAP